MTEQEMKQNRQQNRQQDYPMVYIDHHISFHRLTSSNSNFFLPDDHAFLLTEEDRAVFLSMLIPILRDELTECIEDYLFGQPGAWSGLDIVLLDAAVVSSPLQPVRATEDTSLSGR